ncbi:helix-turn-helix domain-containing protein [Kitasatospora sp. NPDC059646]|uniref:helix-turn-helix domain-containing protein n=1 Tax=Kitasatospora sp. NPDC059646 TaxID=3346893 RepID=UPI0036B64A04
MDEDAWDRPVVRPQSLEELIDLVGPLVETTTLPRAQAPVRQVVVFDPLDRPAGRGDLLVGVGVDPHGAAAEELLRAAGDAGVAGVVLRGARDGGRKQELRTVAERAGTALLFRTAWVDWPRLITTLRAAAATGPVPGSANVPLGDLGGLARLIAVQVQGAVTVEDPDSRVLAHYAESADLDPIRILTISTGQVPEERRRAMTEGGFFKELWSTDQVLHRRAEGDVPERMAVAVQAGGERLGSIWVAALSGRRLQDSAAEALQVAARLAAAHLLHHRSRHHGRSELLAEAARSVLDGRGSGALLARHSGMPADRPCAVLSVGTAGPVDDDLRVRLERLAGWHPAGPGRSSLVLPAEHGVLVLLAGLAADRPTAELQVADFGRRLVADLSARLRTPVLAGLGPVQDRLDHASRSRESADLALSGLRFGRTGPDCATVDEVADAVALQHVLETLRDLPLPVRTSVSRLVAHAEQGGDRGLLDALHAYLDHSRELGRAADSLGVARTTFANRFHNKVLKVSGLDVDNPDARLLAHLQLRLLDHRDPGAS